MTKRSTHSYKYTPLYLLKQQAKDVQKLKQFKVLLEVVSNTGKLSSVRFSRKCYSMLNQARVKPEALSRFLRTFSIPPHPFFRQFLEMKTYYLQKKQQHKEEKRQRINRIHGMIPHDIKTMILFLRTAERHVNSKTLNPVWRRLYFSNTLKRARQLASMHRLEHTDDFFLFNRILSEKYSPFRQKKKVNRKIALFILELPDTASMKQIKQQFRILSKKYHPDTGGDARHFNTLKQAITLLEQN